MGVNDIWIHAEWIVRIIIAAICGSLIGYERSSRNKEAGIRTHSIISLGASLIMVISKYGFLDVGGTDGGRIAAQIVSGVGFLGAGIIFNKHGTISGLTTAAGMWATSGIGMCIGSGLYDIGIGTTFLILIIQKLLHKESIFNLLQSAITIHVEITDARGLIDLQKLFQNQEISVYDIKTERLESNSILLTIECNITSKFRKEVLIAEMVKKSYFKRMYFS